MKIIEQKLILFSENLECSLKYYYELKEVPDIFDLDMLLLIEDLKRTEKALIAIALGIPIVKKSILEL